MIPSEEAETDGEMEDFFRGLDALLPPEKETPEPASVEPPSPVSSPPDTSVDPIQGSIAGTTFAESSPASDDGSGKDPIASPFAMYGLDKPRPLVPFDVPDDGLEILQDEKRRQAQKEKKSWFDRNIFPSLYSGYTSVVEGTYEHYRENFKEGSAIVKESNEDMREAYQKDGFSGIVSQIPSSLDAGLSFWARAPIIEQALQPFKGAGRGILTSGSALMSGLEQITASMNENQNIFLRKRIEYIEELIEKEPDQAKKRNLETILSSHKKALLIDKSKIFADASDGFKSASQSEYIQRRIGAMKDLRKETWFIDTVDYLTGSVGEAAGSMTIPVGATIINPWLGAGVTGFMGVGSVRQALEEEGIDPKDHQQIIYAFGALHGVLDRLGFGGIAKGVRGPLQKAGLGYLLKNAPLEFRKRAERLMITAFSWGFLKNGLREGITEFLQTAIEISAPMRALGRTPGVIWAELEKDVFRGVESRLLESFVQGKVGGGVVGGSLDTASNASRLKNIKARKARIDAARDREDVASEPGPDPEGTPEAPQEAVDGDPEVPASDPRDGAEPAPVATPEAIPEKDPLPATPEETQEQIAAANEELERLATVRSPEAETRRTELEDWVSQLEGALNPAPEQQDALEPKSEPLTDDRIRDAATAANVSPDDLEDLLAIGEGLKHGETLAEVIPKLIEDIKSGVPINGYDQQISAIERALQSRPPESTEPTASSSPEESLETPEVASANVTPDFRGAPNEDVSRGRERQAEPQDKPLAWNTPRKIVTPDGSMEIEVTPQIVELSSLKFASGNLQPRDRTRAESQINIRRIAANLDPAQLQPTRVSDSGSPIVNAAGVIVSGNGRVMAISEVYKDQALKERADAYKASLGDLAEGYQEPVLIARLPADMPQGDLTRFADFSNRSRIGAMSATERARRDAAAAGSEVMELYTGGTFTSTENKPFFRSFMERAVSEAERGSVSKDGVLTKEGEDRMSAAVLAAAYGDPELLSRMLESTDDNIKSITGAMRDAASGFIRLKEATRERDGTVAAKFDITPQIVETAKRIADLRGRNIKLSSFLAQQDAFTQTDPIVEALLRAFYNDDMSRALSREKLTEVLSRYAQEAIKHHKDGLIPDETSPQDIIANARSKALARDREAATQANLFAPRPSPASGTDAGIRGEVERAGDEGRGGQARPEGDGGISASPTPGQQPTAEELKATFLQVLAGTTERKAWAKEIGASPATLKKLIDDAVKAGLLREDRKGVVRRVPKAIEAEVQKKKTTAQAPVSAPPQIPNVSSVASSGLEKAKAKARDHVLKHGRKNNLEYGVVAFPDGTIKPNKVPSTARKDNFLPVNPQTAPDLWTAPTRSVDFHHNHPRSSSFSRADYTEAAPRAALRRTYVHGHDGSEYWAELLADSESLGEAFDLAREATTEMEGDGIARYRTHLVALMLSDAGIINYGATLTPEDASNIVDDLREKIGENWTETVQEIRKIKEDADVLDRGTRPAGKPGRLDGAPGQTEGARSDVAGSQSRSDVRGENALLPPKPITRARANEKLADSITITAEQIFQGRIAARERVKGKPLTPVTRKYADDIESAIPDPAAFKALMIKLQADKAIKADDLTDLAYVSGHVGAKPKNKASALKVIEDRHAALGLSDKKSSAKIAGALYALSAQQDAETGQSMRRALDDALQTSKRIVVAGTTDASGREGLDAKFRRGKVHTIDPNIAAAIHAALSPILHVVPTTLPVGALVKIEPYRNYATTGMVRLTFETADGTKFHEDQPWSAVVDSRAAFLPNAGAIGLLRFGDPDGLGHTFRGELFHEVLHALVRSGRLPVGVLDALAGHSDSLDVLNMGLNDYLRAIGYTNLKGKNAPVKWFYEIKYAERSDFQEMLKQEKATHLVEMAYHGVLPKAKLAPVQDILDDLFAGKFGGRGATSGQGGMAFAIAAQDAAPDRSMRRDIDALGYYSQALEAAKGLKQAKGTPEQMLSLLMKTPGVKEAEIEATRLKESLKGKKSVTRDEIVKYLEENRVALNEVVRNREEGFKSEVNRRMEEWREEQREQAKFDELSERYQGETFFESTKAFNKVVARLKKDGTVFNEELLEEDPTAAFEESGLKVTMGKIEIWDDSNGSYFIIEKPDGRAIWTSKYDTYIEETASKREAIEILEDLALDYVNDTIREQEHYVEENFRHEAEEEGTDDSTKWSKYSLDPYDPTYQERVLHLPEDFITLDEVAEDLGYGEFSSRLTAEQKAAVKAEKARREVPPFRSGHFPEPNITGHLMTSLVRTADGKPVFLVNQIQSDWGQKLRDGGVRDEANIARLKEKYDAAIKKISALEQKLNENHGPGKLSEMPDINSILDKTKDLMANGIELEEARKQRELFLAELRTTDQWVNTTLRRAIRIAIEARAEFIAIPTGDTVLSYNPGDTEGMRGFYGSSSQEGIVPKNLRKLLAQIDKESPKAERVATLDSPSGKKNLGEGFTMFPLTEKVKDSIRKEGLPLFALAGAEQAEPTPRTNQEGFILRLPFAERWGDPRFNAQDRERALGRLREIQNISVDTASWGDLLKARTDINEVVSQIFFYAPDFEIEKISIVDNVSWYIDDINWISNEKPERVSSVFMKLYDDRIRDVKDIIKEGKAAIDHMLASKRKGIKRMLEYSETPKEKTITSPKEKKKINIEATMPSGFYFLAARNLADVPDALFQQGGQAVIDWLRKSGVKLSEIEHFQLLKKFGGARKVTRSEFESAIAEHMFDFKRKVSWLNPERSKKDYELGGTRAFRGPRIPGRGVYFEDVVAFPKKLAGGAPFAPGHFVSPHWEDILQATWSSWRGSLRDVPEWGRMMIGEEGQTDFMQGAMKRRPRISEKEYLAFKGERANFDKVMDEVYNIANDLSYNINFQDYNDRWNFVKNIVPSQGDREFSYEDWNAFLNEASRDQKASTESYNFAEKIERIQQLRLKNEKFFEPGALDKYKKTESSFTPESPLDESYVHNMVRELLLLAAKKKAGSIAISTSETTNRIQINTHTNAAHFYDGQLKKTLEKELRRLTGDGSLELQLLKLTKAMGAPKNEKAYTVWAAKLPPDVLAKISKGQPMLAIAGGNAAGADQGALSKAKTLEKSRDPQPRAPRETPAFLAKKAEFIKVLTRDIQNILPSDIAVRFTDRLLKQYGQKVDAQYDSMFKALEIALSGGFERAVQTGLRHEPIHVLREMDLFRPEEWSLLLERANKIGIDAQITVKNRYGDEIPGIPIYRDAYQQMAANAGMLGAEAEAWVEERLNQERVAKMAENWVSKGVRYGSKIDALIQRIVQLFEKIKNALRGLGFQTYDDVFEKAFSGKVARRAEGGRRETSFEPQVPGDLAQILDELAAMENSVVVPLVAESDVSVSISGDGQERQRQARVSVAAHPDRLIAWGKKLSEQSPLVKAAFAGLGIKEDGVVSEGVAAKIKTDPEAIEDLRNAGVAGIRYQDAGTSENRHVVFDADALDVATPQDPEMSDGLPHVALGFTRIYRGENQASLTGPSGASSLGRWFTTDFENAIGYAAGGPVYWVDVTRKEFKTFQQSVLQEGVEFVVPQEVADLKQEVAKDAVAKAAEAITRKLDAIYGTPSEDAAPIAFERQNSREEFAAASIESALSGKAKVYAARFADAGADEANFSETFGLMTSDKGLTTAQANAIAREFLGKDGAFASRKEAFLAIKTAFDAGAKEAGRQEVITALKEAKPPVKTPSGGEGPLFALPGSVINGLSALARRIAAGTRRALPPGAPPAPAATPPSSTEPIRALSEIVTDLQTALGLLTTQGLSRISIREPSSGRTWNIPSPAGSRGQYDRGVAAARTRLSRDIEAVALEGGRHVERLLGAPLQDLLNTHAMEIMGARTSAGPTPSETELSAAFTQWFRDYIVDPTAAERNAPNFHEDFNDLLDARRPDLLERIERVQLTTLSQEYRAYLAATTVQRATADLVSHADRRVSTRLMKFLRDVGQEGTVSGFVTRVYSQTYDDTNALYQMVRKGLEQQDRNRILDAQGRPISLKIHENPQKLARSLKDSFKTGLRWVQEGMPNYRHQDGGFEVIARDGRNVGFGRTRAEAEAAAQTVPGARIRTRWGQRSKSLHDALMAALGNTWSHEKYQEFGAYLESRRAVEEWKNWDQKQNDISQLIGRITAAETRRLAITARLAKERAKASTANDALVRVETRLVDARRAQRTSETENRNLAERINELQSDLAEAERAIYDGSTAAKEIARRKRVGLALARRRENEAFRELKGFNAEVLKLESERTTAEAEASNAITAQQASDRAIKSHDQTTGQLKADLDRLRKEGLQRPPHMVSRAEHEQRTVDLERANPRFDAAAKMVYDFLWQSAVFDFQSGRLTQAQLDYRRTRSHYYVPFARDMSDLDQFGSQIGARAKKLTQDKAFKGSNRAIINPLEVIVEQAFHRSAGTRVNEMALALARLSERVGPGGAAIAERMTREEVLVADAAGFQRIERELIDKGFDPSDARDMALRLEANWGDANILFQSEQSKGPKRPLLIPFFENGERHYLRINDVEHGQEVAKMLNAIGGELSHAAFEVMARFSSTLRMSVTSHPAFITKNILRDMWSAWIYTGEVLDPRTWPMINQVRGLKHEFLQTELAKMYQEVGGLMGGQNVAALSPVLHKTDMMALRAKGLHLKPVNLGIGVGSGVAMGALLNVLGLVVAGPVGGLVAAAASPLAMTFGGVVGAGLSRGPSKFFETLAMFSDLSETASRLGVFAKAYETAARNDPTLTPYEVAERAAYVARDVIDFGRRGSNMAAIARIVPFMNASMQGPEKAMRQFLGESDRGFTVSRAKLGVSSLIGGGLGLAAGSLIGFPVAGAAAGATLGPTIHTNLQMRTEYFRQRLKPILKQDLGLPLSADEEQALANSAKAWNHLVIMTIAFLAMSALYMGDDDDDDDNKRKQRTTSDEYRGIKDLVKNKAAPVKVMATWLAIPRPFELGLPSVLVEAGIMADMNHDPDFWNRARGTIFDAITPPFIPQGIKLWANVRSNYDDFRDMPIIPDRVDDLNPEFQSGADSSGFAVGLGEQIGVSPYIVDYVLTAGFGYWGRDVQKASGFGGPRGPGSERTIDMPLIGTIVQSLTIDPLRQSDARENFYDMMKTVRTGLSRVSANLDSFLKVGDAAGANQYLATIDEDARAYALVMAQAETDKRRMHPMNRLDDINAITTDMQRRIRSGDLNDHSSHKERVKVVLGPVQAASIMDTLAQIAEAENINTFIALKKPGYENRETLDISEMEKVLKAQSKEVYNEYERRREGRKIETLEDVLEKWPKIKKKLLEDWEDSLTSGDFLVKNEKERRPPR